MFIDLIPYIDKCKNFNFLFAGVFEYMYTIL